MEVGVREAASQQTRRIDTNGIKDLLYQSFDHPRWDNVAQRCLACANCTMVCPTCFCTTVEDVSDVSGDHAERWRRWDSCFTLSFSYIHGGSIRTSGQGPIPAMDDSQASLVDRPVWHFRMRWLRALHHVVSGGDRHY